MQRAWLAGAVSFLLAGCGSLGGSTTAAPSPVPAASAPSVPASGVARDSDAATAPSSAIPSTPPEPTSSPVPPPPTLQSAFEEVRSGVVRFEVAGCDGSTVGTGFQLTETMVVTAAHVVDDGQVIRVIGGTTSTAAVLVGADQGADVALVQTVAPLNGHLFRFAEEPPRIGDQIAAVGFPLGLPLAFHTGTVNGLDRKVEIDGVSRYGLVELDAAITRGNSGGPVIVADGSVVGIVHAELPGGPGRRWAVSSATARPLVDRWLARPDRVPVDGCTELAAGQEPAGSLPDPLRKDAQAFATLNIYFASINSGDFATALAQLADPGPLEEFVDAVASSYDTDIRYREVQDRGAELVVWVTFTSRQETGRGPVERPDETCTDWSLDYVLVPRNGLWLIESTQTHDAEPRSRPCPATTAPGTTSGD